MRWRLDGNGIVWDVRKDANLPHEDHLEMSGRKVSLIVRYGVGEGGRLFLKRHLVWPMLRTIPNNTHASFRLDAEDAWLPSMEMDGTAVEEYPEVIRFDGVLDIDCRTQGALRIRRRLFPCVDARSMCETVTVTNTGGKPCRVVINNNGKETYGRGCNGVYVVCALMTPSAERVLQSGETMEYGLQISARLANEPYERLDAAAELLRRQARVAELQAPLDLHTGVAEIDAEYKMCKLRTGESIFDTHGGPMHGPGGDSYYAATWCNDQVEYAGPWFAFTGDKLALDASLNAYRHYMPFMGPDFHRIPSSVIAEGFDIWEGAGDRGDAAMYAYGATRFVLASGRRDFAITLWPGIKWTLEYCRRKVNEKGVVASDSDELEGRLPHGDANLNTSALYYGGLTLGAKLAAELGETQLVAIYQKQACELEKAIESHFGRTLHGFKTYQYFDGCDVPRSWIGIPLCMGIETRAESTVAAMFSPYLWNGEGMLSQEGDKITWDRSLLYGFRGAFAAGYGATVMDKFQAYSASRLLGEHVPYPVEAWPEGNRRHLAAESALYCRIVTEGMFGIVPQGLRSFIVKPWLPDGCKCMVLRSIRAFGHEFDIVADAKRTLLVENGRETVVNDKLIKLED